MRSEAEVKRTKHFLSYLRRKGRASHSIWVVVVVVGVVV